MSDLSSRKLKAKKLGVLIRNARQVACKEQDECAEAIGSTVEKFVAYELGQQAPSLPELELLAYYLKVPVDHFLSDDGLLEEQEATSNVDLQRLLSLRQKIIGVVLRKRRLEKGLSLEDVAEKTGVELSQLQAYEFGLDPIPVPELTNLALELDWHLRGFQDTTGPVGTWIVQQRYLKSFTELEVELQEFVSKPVNRPYLEVAQRLSEMSADKLRIIAETLLEITL